MLTIKCAKCKNKLFKYKKIGQGKVLRCYESKITRLYDGELREDNFVCKKCGNIVGQYDEGQLDMNADAFTYSGTKIKK